MSQTLQKIEFIKKKYIFYHGSDYKLPYFVPLRTVPSEKRIYIKKNNEVPSNIWFALGIRGAGKSSFLEYLGELYIRCGVSVIDIFGSRDGEGLAWLRSPWAKVLNILILHSPALRIQTYWKNIRVIPYSRFSHAMTEEYDLIISAAPLYTSMKEEYDAINYIIDRLFERKQWKRPAYMLVREAARLLYSRIRAYKDQVVAKAQYISLIREFRHMGISMGLDTQKFTSVDLDVRTQVDYLVIKNLGNHKLPDDLRWIYAFISPEALISLEPQEYIILSRTGLLGTGIFPYPKWHKRPGEDIMEHVPLVIKN